MTYDEEQIAEIFELAARAESERAAAPRARSALTLSELQDVGREVGLDPHRVAAAAAEIAARSEVRPAVRRFGMPAVVGREVPLDREPTDEEWKLLLAGLREDCGSHARDLRRGPVREWTCADVIVRVEPVDDGQYRLRLQAERDPARGATLLGGAVAVVGAALMATSGLDAVTFGPVLETLLPALMTLIGGGAAAGNVVRMRRWASARERMFEQVSRRVREMFGT